MDSNILEVSIDKTDDISIILGGDYQFDINFKNLSQSIRLYNLRLYLTLPDGMSLIDSTTPPTSIDYNQDNSTTYSWINLKDLAPMEIDYIFSVTVRCSVQFADGSDIPFGYSFSGVSIYCEMDTLPRGSYDIDNEIIISEVFMSYIAEMFSSFLSTPGKVLKGAGFSIDSDDYTQIYQCICDFSNNFLSESYADISILLQDGIRYIGNIIVTGTDSSSFINPIINTVIIDGKTYTQILFKDVFLSIGSSTRLTFSYAVWNRYNNNNGEFILHGSNLSILCDMYCIGCKQEYISSSSTSFAAMDLIIVTSASKSIIDIRLIFMYYFTFKIGQYYNLRNLIVNYRLPDGISYLSSSINPDQVIKSEEYNGYYLTYNFGLQSLNSSTTVEIEAQVDEYYSYKQDNQGLDLPLVAYDLFKSYVDVSAEVITDNPYYISDNSSASSVIDIGDINQKFVKAYYKDLTPKDIDTLSPGDFAEFTLYYDPSNLEAMQKSVYLSDFFPLSLGPIDNLDYIYTGIKPIVEPYSVYPHGIDFNYGDIEGLSSGSINFKVPVLDLGDSSFNFNLLKLRGINSEGYSYSDRNQVVINLGSPNLNLTKSVYGPKKNRIRANETYTFEVTINNSNNLGTETDAFDFILSDELSTQWFDIDLNSIEVLGDGDFENAVVEDEKIYVYINKLAPGQYVTLKYNVIINNTLAPGLRIKTTATNTNPYSQVYNDAEDNFQFKNQDKRASTILRSVGVSINKKHEGNLLKVGSFVFYTVTVVVPQGTIVYNLYVEDTLPNNYQIYQGPAYKNNTLVEPIVSENKITFATEDIIDARNSSQTIVYTFRCRIIDDSVDYNTITSTQTNSAKCFYQVADDKTYFSVNNNLNITVNHPRLTNTLTVRDAATGVVYTDEALVSTNSILQFNLEFNNNSYINLANGTIEIPIDDQFVFSSIDFSILCNAIYDEEERKIIINIPKLAPSESGYLRYTVTVKPDSKSGSIMNTNVITISYYNDIYPDKKYTNDEILKFVSKIVFGLSLKPDPNTQINENTSITITQPGKTAVISNYFENTGGGYDDFSLTIEKTTLDYTLYIDDKKIADVKANNKFESSLDVLQNVAPKETHVIEIHAPIPAEQTLGTRHDFIVTAKSRNEKSLEKTVINIDPEPF